MASAPLESERPEPQGQIAGRNRNHHGAEQGDDGFPRRLLRAADPLASMVGSGEFLGHVSAGRVRRSMYLVFSPSEIDPERHADWAAALKQHLIQREEHWKRRPHLPRAHSWWDTLFE